MKRRPNKKKAITYCDISPFQGLCNGGYYDPARCAGLLNFAPSGLFKMAVSSPVDRANHKS
jgi:hypothetical protein